MFKAIVGLGNPGPEYERTRHNLGFMVVRALSKKLECPFKKEIRFEGWHARLHGRAKERLGAKESVELFFPSTYMNESGRAVGKLLRYYGIEPQELIVVVDDMALEFGQLRLKVNGSSGGHNGLRSIENCLGSQEYARLRVGIGKPKHGDVDHVLGEFSAEETKELKAVIESAVECLEQLYREDFARVATKVNKRNTDEKSTTGSNVV